MEHQDKGVVGKNTTLLLMGKSCQKKERYTEEGLKREHTGKAPHPCDTAAIVAGVDGTRELAVGAQDGGGLRAPFIRALIIPALTAVIVPITHPLIRDAATRSIALELFLLALLHLWQVKA